MSRTGRAAVFGVLWGAVVATGFGIFFFTTTDTFAATLGLIGIVVFLSIGVLAGVIVVQRYPDVRVPARQWLLALTLVVLVAWLYIFLRYR